MMKYFLIIAFGLFFSFGANAQSQKAKEKFMKEVFNDFKKNRIESITNRFVDSILLDKLIIEYAKKGEEIPKRYTPEKIHKQRSQAQAQFAKSLNSAYEKYKQKGFEKKLRQVNPEMETYSGGSIPIPTFGIKYTFEIDDFEIEMKIGRVLYDPKRKRFAILSNRVRHYMLPNDIEIAEIKEEKLSENSDIGEEEVMELPEPPPVSEKMIKERLLNGSDIRASEPEIFQFVEVMPEFPGGQEAMMRFISKNIEYPALAKENNIEGKVYAKFVVGRDGMIRDIKVIRGIGGGCDQEAVRVIKSMPKWKPGMQRGIAVPVMFTLPFSFKLK